MSSYFPAPFFPFNVERLLPGGGSGPWPGTFQIPLKLQVATSHQATPNAVTYSQFDLSAVHLSYCCSFTGSEIHWFAAVTPKSQASFHIVPSPSSMRRSRQDHTLTRQTSRKPHYTTTSLCRRGYVTGIIQASFIVTHRGREQSPLPTEHRLLHEHDVSEQIKR